MLIEGKSKIEIEIDFYNSVTRPQSGHINPLMWWANYTKQMPLLTALVRKYLCIPVTSASSERSFSAAGAVATDKRYCF
jgi:hypothetical protein